MSKFSLNQLTEGIRQRHMGAQNRQLVEKWSRTGLLRGLNGVGRENMAMLLENQAAQALREANTLGSGTAASSDIRGFQNIAFPIVRRVFGGLVANELVSIQPMSLPSGLLFYLDYTYGSSVGGDVMDQAGNAATYVTGSSIYNSPSGKSVRTGSDAVGGQYDLAGSGYSRVHGSVESAATGLSVLAYGSWGSSATQSHTESALLGTSGSDGKLIQFDPQLSDLIDAEGQSYQGLVISMTGSSLSTADFSMVKDFAIYDADGASSPNALLAALPSGVQSGQAIKNIRRLNQLGTYTSGKFTPNPLVTQGTTNAALFTVIRQGTSLVAKTGAFNGNNFESLLGLSFVKSPATAVDFDNGSIVSPVFEHGSTTGVESPAIPEIDIKIESIAVTAVSRKLKAKWTPELAQDLNAYHSLDAEVELTQILSEQIALELDREILNDLLTQAKGANYYWSRMPGKFVNKTNGQAQERASSLQGGPSFAGTAREWYETLTETIIDVANTIHRKTLRGSANFIVVGPDVATILEASVMYRPSYSLDGDGQVGTPFSIGAEKVGTLSNRFTVYKDPYFPRNKVLVGYKGGSYLETGYVYAPYVPLIVTPTIFQPEDFTPRKGVMTRYGKKMVRADFYGTVTCMDMNII